MRLPTLWLSIACAAVIGCGDDSEDNTTDSGVSNVTVLPDGAVVSRPVTGSKDLDGGTAPVPRAKSLDGVWVATEDPPSLARYAAGSSTPSDTISLEERPQYVEIVDGVAFYVNDTIHASGPSPLYYQNLLTGEHGEIALAEQTSTGSLAYADGSLWLADEATDALWRVNPKTREVVGGVKLGLHESSTSNDGNDLAVSETDIFVSSFFGGDSLTRVGISSMKTEVSGAEADGATGVAVGAGSVWLVSRFDGMLRRYDPSTLKLQAEIDIDADISTQVRPVAVGAGSVWVLTGEGGNAQAVCCEMAKPGLTRVDVATNKVLAHIPLEHPAGLRVQGDEVWVSTDESALLLDPATNTFKRTLTLPGTVADVSFAQTGGGGGSTAGRPKIDVYSVVEPPPMICDGLSFSSARPMPVKAGTGTATLTASSLSTMLGSGTCETLHDANGKVTSYRVGFANGLPRATDYAAVTIADYTGDGSYADVDLVWDLSAGESDYASATAVVSNGGLHGVITSKSVQLEYNCSADSQVATTAGAPLGKAALGEAILHDEDGEVLRFAGIGCRKAIVGEGLLVEAPGEQPSGDYYLFELESNDPPESGKPVEGWLDYTYRGFGTDGDSIAVTIQLTCSGDAIEGTFASEDKEVEGSFRCPKDSKD